MNYKVRVRCSRFQFTGCAKILHLLAYNVPNLFKMTWGGGLMACWWSERVFLSAVHCLIHSPLHWFLADQFVFTRLCALLIPWLKSVLHHLRANEEDLLIIVKTLGDFMTWFSKVPSTNVLPGDWNVEYTDATAGVNCELTEMELCIESQKEC